MPTTSARSLLALTMTSAIVVLLTMTRSCAATPANATAFVSPLTGRDLLEIGPLESLSLLVHGEDSTNSADRAVRQAQLGVERELKNNVVLFWLPRELRAGLPRVIATWARNYVAGLVLYLGVNTLWCAAVYTCSQHYRTFPERVPTAKAIGMQIGVSLRGLPLYTALPTLSEWMIEQGWTCAYPRVANVGGWPTYAALTALYMLSVEFGVYWMHRLLHDIKPAYKLLHHTHHVYNKEHTLSPFAGLAFNPWDGILQAVPYVWTLFYVPCHALSHEVALFMTAFWTTNIHDCLVIDAFPIMGSGFHTIHHTTYKHNYGHYTVLFDWLFGTLRYPDYKQYAKELKAAKAQ